MTSSPAEIPGTGSSFAGIQLTAQWPTEDERRKKAGGDGMPQGIGRGNSKTVHSKLKTGRGRRPLPLTIQRLLDLFLDFRLIDL